MKNGSSGLIIFSPNTRVMGNTLLPYDTNIKLLMNNLRLLALCRCSSPLATLHRKIKVMVYTVVPSNQKIRNWRT